MKVRKYVSLPIVVEAVMLRHGNLKEVANWCDADMYGYFPVTNEAWLKIRTLEGEMLATQDDYIIKGTKGEFYPCKNDIFNHKYEEAMDFEEMEEQALHESGAPLSIHDLEDDKNG